MNQQYYVQLNFFDSLNNPVTTPQISGSIYVSTNYNILTLEVKGSTSIDLVIEGCVINKDSKGNELTDDECQWIPINTLNITNFNTSENITSNGIYQVSLQGIMKLRANLKSISGTAQIYGIMEN